MNFKRINRKEMKLTDESIMKFGKYKGRELCEIPASYFIWFEGELLKKSNTRYSEFHRGLLAYVKDNRNVLEKQAVEENG